MGLDDHTCNTGLVLGLGFSSTVQILPKSDNQQLPRTVKTFEPSLTLGICSKIDDDQELIYHQDSGTSSFSNGSTVKRERDEEEEEIDDIDDANIVNARKKLRLNKDQAAVLEESFKLHSTLNPRHKQELARKLNLRPRQVEVWFQNRRARTKLKQTEADCEYLKKCCENLTDENRRLKKELNELKSLKLSEPPYYMQLPPATLSMCPSCEKISGNGANGTSPKGPISLAMSTKPHCFFNPFTNHSAAC